MFLVTSQSTDPIKWLIHPQHSIEIFGHIDTCKKYSWHQYVVHHYLCNCDWYIYTGRTGVLVDCMHYLQPQQTVLCVAIRVRATPGHFLFWMRTVRQLRHVDYRGVFMLKFDLYWWTRQRNFNTLIVVYRYLRPMGDKMIPDSAEPRLL